MTRAPTDGRRRRGRQTRNAILVATRRLMVAGNFRPTAEQIQEADGFTERVIFQHFPSLEALYIVAIDAETAHAIVSLLPVDSEMRLALAVVLGRLS